jgi:RHS repeat-associated protein
MANDGTRVMAYDVYNRLLSVTGSGVNLRLIYDPEGRLAKYSTDGGTKYQTLLYDGTNLIGEYDSAGTMLRRYIHGTKVDEPLVWFEGADLATKRFFVQNYQGSVIGYTDASGNFAELYKYGPYGEPKNANNAESWTGSRFRYTGQTSIPEAKLYYYKARVYDPVYGRFLQTDPIGSKDDLNLYGYTKGDPVNYIDPAGTDTLAVYRPIIPGIDHQAKYVGNDKTGWTYISKDGARESNNGGFSGPSEVTIGKFKTFGDVLKHASKEGYVDAYRNASTPKQDTANIAATLGEANKDYNLTESNCGQTCAIGDRAAGFPEYDNVNPRDNKEYMESKQGKKDGWKGVLLPGQKKLVRADLPRSHNYCEAKIGVGCHF